ncbi:ParB family protein [Pseudomonas fluorescens]|jgi:ParB family protein of integrating conjugative element (PFGI_1 class)|uniref:ParB family protein n=1 Tax=Pseudomonas lurida TaxID=244566 RepID=A0ABY9FX84_9PSED|nr:MULTISPECIES: ParB family protein [Pseudomonas]MBD8739107.1 ParB family protein [Pseudomonas fluorescens]MBC3248609.1 ParB family protein [Pseudomonas lurida]NWB73137.1 ParB family protein [Pseudomonas sp. G5001]TKK05132.1 transcriptional regulator [Pseudomonas fluorescens]WLH07932.1 ParB family protein [Pseudomonas lurida]
MKQSLAQTMKEKLQLPGFESKSPAAARLSDPIVDTPMLLTLDETLPYDENPRTTRNPKYDDIKESIRQRGLDTPPPVTRKPGEEKFRIRNGGNTRLAILNELYRETGDEKFFRFHCLFRPWDAVRGEIISLTGHLAENDLQGQLLFIERAIGVDKARALYENEVGEPISLRELSRRLGDDGYPISASHLSRMLDAIRYLLPTIPGVLYSGLGVDRIIKLLSLRKTAFQCWERNYQQQEKELPLEFETVFQDVLSQFEGDAEEFLFQRFQDELIAQLQKPLNLGYEKILLEITQNQDQLRRSTPILELPQPSITFGGVAQGVSSTETGNNPPQNLAQQSPAPQTGGAIQTSTTQQQSKEPHKPQLTPPPLEQMSPEEQKSRLDGHVASPVKTSARVEKMKREVAALDGEILPDFAANALVAIPVQAGGLNPISDLWYIEREIDNPITLRQHIAQLAREVASTVNAPGEFLDVDGGVGFSYRHPSEDIEVTATAHHTLTLLQSLSGSTAIALKMIQQQPELQVDALTDFEFAAGLGQILLGQPYAKDQSPDNTNRLSDGALVKLFRIIRLARRLIDLEIKSMANNNPSSPS